MLKFIIRLCLRYIYVIYQPGGPYRAQFFCNQTDLGGQITWLIYPTLILSENCQGNFDIHVHNMYSFPRNVCYMLH